MEGEPVASINHNLSDTNTTESNEFSTGDWCVVMYDGENYPGEITNVIGQEIQVQVMHRAGNYFKWPCNPDKIYYTQDDILKKIQPPVVVGSRGQFRFDNFE